MKEFVRANSRHPGSSARGGGSGPPRRVLDSVASVISVISGISGISGAAPSGEHFRAPLSRMRRFAVTAAGSKTQFGATLSTMRPLRCGANPSLCAWVRIFEHPCRRCGSIAVALRSQGRSFKHPCPRRGPFVVMLRPRASRSYFLFFPYIHICILYIQTPDRPPLAAS